MESNEKKNREKENKTPIIDGDARPDMNVTGEENKTPRDHPIETPRDREKKEMTAEKKSATTANRNDANSLEDFRDARQE